LATVLLIYDMRIKYYKSKNVFSGMLHINLNFDFSTAKIIP